MSPLKIMGNIHKQNSKQYFSFWKWSQMLRPPRRPAASLTRFSSFGATWTLLMVAARVCVKFWLFVYQATWILPLKREKENKDCRTMQSPGQMQPCLALLQPYPCKVRTAHLNGWHKIPEQGRPQKLSLNQKIWSKWQQVTLLLTGHQWSLVNSHNGTTPAEGERKRPKKALEKYTVVHRLYKLSEKSGFKKQHKWEAIQEDQHEVCTKQLKIKQLRGQKQDANRAKGQGSQCHCPLGANQCGRQITPGEKSGQRSPPDSVHVFEETKVSMRHWWTGNLGLSLEELRWETSQR